MAGDHALPVAGSYPTTAALLARGLDAARALTEITAIEDRDPGDLVLTGTPGGVALKPSPPAIQRFAGLFSEERRLALFLRSQSGRREYLQPGDRVQATIRTPDGALDLGEQANLVR